MNVPGSVRCDFCKEPILEGVPYTKIDVPLPPAVRREIRAATEKENGGPTLPSRGFLGQVVSVEQVTPHRWTIEMCLGCTTGLLPQVMEAVKEEVRHCLDRSRDAKQRHSDALSAFDESE